MDEEKFSIERFWELMGAAPRGETVEGEDMEPDLSTEGEMFHVEQRVWTDVRERETVERRTEAAAGEVGEERAEKPKPSEDRRDVLRARAVRRETVEDAEASVKPRRGGVIERVVETVRRVFGWGGVAADKAASAAVEEGAETIGTEREAYDEREVSGDGTFDVERKGVVFEDVSSGRSRRRVEVEGRVETVEAVKRSKREFAESDGILTESRRVLTEFRKSGTDSSVDLRAISRAIERDARRY